MAHALSKLIAVASAPHLSPMFYSTAYITMSQKKVVEMKKSMILVVFISVFVSNVNAAEFIGGIENQLRINTGILMFADMLQTNEIANTTCVYETNLALGNQPDETKVVPYFVIVTLGGDYLMQKYLSKKQRIVGYAGVMLLEGYLTIKNNPDLGIKSPNFYVQFKIKF